MQSIWLLSLILFLEKPTIHLILALLQITNEVPDKSASTVWMCFILGTFNQGSDVFSSLPGPGKTGR